MLRFSEQETAPLPHGRLLFFRTVIFMNRGNAIRKYQENKKKDGRGQGYGADYKPFIQASD